MNEKLHRLVMHAFRGVPSEMTVDFGKGESTVVYGDNGTGKSTIADALEWYFTGDIELLSHEGRQHAVRYVGGDGDGVTSVEVRHQRHARGKVVFPDERTPDMFRALRRETFLLRGRTLADFINKTKTEKWKALVEILGLDAIESLREDLQRARNDLRKAAKAAEEEARVYRRALSAGADTVTEETVLDKSSADLRDAGRQSTAVAGSSGRPLRGSRRPLAPAQRRRFVRSREPPGGNQRARQLRSSTRRRSTAWNALVASDRARLLPRASLVREAKRLVEARSIEAGRCPLCGQKVDEKVLAQRIESALVEMMEAARDLERFRDPVLEQADGLESAHDLRRAIYDRARAAELDDPACSRAAGRRGSGTRSMRWQPSISTRLRAHLADMRRWDKAAAKLARQVSPRRTQHAGQSARDAGRAVPADQCLAPGGEEERSRRAGAGAG